jgi:UDP-N-acetylglucosamine pyrophosphorylase
MPLDYFRSNSSFFAHNVYGSNNNIGNITLSGNLLAENESLRKEIASIKKTIEALEETIKTKDEMIALLKSSLPSK